MFRQEPNRTPERSARLRRIRTRSKCTGADCRIKCRVRI